MLQSNTSFYLKSVIQISDTTGDTFILSNDLELDAELDTDWKEVSIVFSNKRQIERMTVTIASWVATIVKRWLSQKWGAESSLLNKQWLEGVIGYITALDFDILEKDSTDAQTITSDLTLEGDNTYNGTATFTDAVDMQDEFKLPVFADTTERDAVYTSPVTGDKCIISGTGEQYYEGGAWNTLWVWSPTPNASETVAGKIELATAAERAAWTSTGGTGAILVPTNDALVKTSSGASDENKIPLLNASGKVDDFVTQINERIEETTIADDDTLPFYDDSAGSNKKITKSSIDAYYGDVVSWTTYTYLEANTERTSSSSSMTKIKELLCQKTGVFTVSFDGSRSANTANPSIQVYINSSAVGDLYNTLPFWSFTTYSQNFFIKQWDLVQIYFQNSSTSSAIVKNFNMKYDISSWVTAWTVNTD